MLASPVVVPSGNAADAEVKHLPVSSTVLPEF